MSKDSPDRCPPHYFQPGWRTDEIGLIFCRLCGEVRDLEPAKIEAPVEESISVRTKERRP